MQLPWDWELQPRAAETVAFNARGDIETGHGNPVVGNTEQQRVAILLELRELSPDSMWGRR